MYQNARHVRFICLIVFLFSLVLFFAPKTIRALSQALITASVQVSVCGNFQAESKEDCDGPDITGKVCQDLGFTGGSLGCNLSCNFDTSNCIVPQIDKDNVEESEVDNLVAAGLLTPPSGESVVSTPSLTATDDIKIVIPGEQGNFEISQSDGTVITTSDDSEFNPQELSAGTLDDSGVEGLESGKHTAASALQWGISGKTLEFDPAITITIPVGNSYNGQTLNVFRSSQMTTGWNTEGLVSATCLVAAGKCSFSTTMASYFIAVASSQGSTTSTTSNTTTTSTGTSTSATPTPSPKTIPARVRQVVENVATQATSEVLAMFSPIITPFSRMSPTLAPCNDQTRTLGAESGKQIIPCLEQPNNKLVLFGLFSLAGSIVILLTHKNKPKVLAYVIFIAMFALLIFILSKR